jgi:hypothetical protein
MIICTELYNGKAHDGAIFRRTTRVNPEILILADSGYRGMHRYHAKVMIPIRHKSDIEKLSEDQKLKRKANNKAIASQRMKIEHVIGRVKRFRIVAEKYRNRLRRLLLRFNLICGIVNFEKCLG